MSQGKVFDAFFIVDKPNKQKPGSNISAAPTSGTNVKSSLIAYQFPQKLDKEVLNVDQIPLFCFPGWPSEDSRSDNGDDECISYSFALQAFDGSRRYGFCNRTKVNKKKLLIFEEEDEQCYCIISFHPWFSLFWSLLVIAKARRHISGEKSLTSFLETILKHPFPFPGERFAIRSATNSTMLDGTHYLTRPDDDRFPLADVKLEDLLSKFDLTQLITLFECALQEMRFVFCGSDINLVSSSVHALVALIYPFSWQHIFVPVLPYKLLNYVCAPMPFIVGIHTSMLKEVRQLPTEKLVIVDLNNNIIEGGESVATLPNYNKLYNSIDKLYSSTKFEYNSFWTEKILDCFLDFFVEVFGDYRLFMDEEDGKYKFDEDRFILSKNETTQVFLQHLRQCQHYQQFINERLELFSTKALPPGIFEMKCSKQLPHAYGMVSSGSMSKKSAFSGGNDKSSIFKRFTQTLFNKKQRPSILHPNPTQNRLGMSKPPLRSPRKTTVEIPPTAPKAANISDLSNVINVMKSKPKDTPMLDMESQSEPPLSFVELHKLVEPPIPFPKTPLTVNLKKISAEFDEFFAEEKKADFNENEVVTVGENAEDAEDNGLEHVLSKISMLETQIKEHETEKVNSNVLDLFSESPAGSVSLSAVHDAPVTPEDLDIESNKDSTLFDFDEQVVPQNSQIPPPDPFEESNEKEDDHHNDTGNNDVTLEEKDESSKKESNLGDDILSLF